MSMGRNYVSEMLLPMGLLFITEMMYEYGQPRWYDIARGNRRTRREICPGATLSTTDRTCTDLGVNPSLRGEAGD
jgi:hypothetical protein